MYSIESKSNAIHKTTKKMNDKESKLQFKRVPVDYLFNKLTILFESITNETALSLHTCRRLNLKFFFLNMTFLLYVEALWIETNLQTERGYKERKPLNQLRDSWDCGYDILAF